MHKMTSGWLGQHDWPALGRSFSAQRPCRYVVIDNFIGNDRHIDIRRILVNDWRWRHKDWASDHLHNARPSHPAIEELLSELELEAAPILGESRYVDHWALMYPRNTKGRLHVDNAALALSLWLTPDRYNLDPGSGGLLLYDVCRPNDIRVSHEYTAENAGRYIEKRTHGVVHRIPYRENRAILFDCSYFHCTDNPNFDCTTPDGYRINLSVAFDN